MACLTMSGVLAFVLLTRGDKGITREMDEVPAAAVAH
jgi:hypothetical protein